MTEKIKKIRGKRKFMQLWEIQNFSNIILNHHKDYDSNANFKNENLQLLFNYMNGNNIPQGNIFNLIKTKTKKININDLNEFVDNYQKQNMNFYRGFNFYISKNKFASDYEKNPTIQYGGGEFTTNLKSFDPSLNYSYIIKYYKIDNKDKTHKNRKEIVITSDGSDPSYNKICISLSYESKNKLDIVSLSSESKCYTIKDENNNEITNQRLNSGTVMMYIIISFAKKHKFKSITLLDKAESVCVACSHSGRQSDTQKELIKYNMAYVGTLCDGHPWYYKFGFNYINIHEHDKVFNNKNKLLQIKTSDFSFEQIMTCFMKTCVDFKKYDYFTDIGFIHDLNKFPQIYTETKDKCIVEFFKLMREKCCSIMSIMALPFFYLIQLELYCEREMILYLE